MDAQDRIVELERSPKAQSGSLFAKKTDTDEMDNRNS
jgi:hypothetical protein